MLKFVSVVDLRISSSFSSSCCCHVCDYCRGCDGCVVADIAGHHFQMGRSSEVGAAAGRYAAAGVGQAAEQRDDAPSVRREGQRRWTVDRTSNGRRRLHRYGNASASSPPQLNLTCALRVTGRFLTIF